ncbi:uncharacterized protein LOC143235417 isoform X2 [Tachypleus tridentatus]|uniref:uncharacterized protein LOC143235417 isoform X2 n=1 Tax=Tachypleus tridentatus TaxID=6853 RepID=UPI003FD4A47F
MTSRQENIIMKKQSSLESTEKGENVVNHQLLLVKESMNFNQEGGGVIDHESTLMLSSVNVDEKDDEVKNQQNVLVAFKYKNEGDDFLRKGFKPQEGGNLQRLMDDSDVCCDVAPIKRTERPYQNRLSSSLQFETDTPDSTDKFPHEGSSVSPATPKAVHEPVRQRQISETSSTSSKRSSIFSFFRK